MIVLAKIYLRSALDETIIERKYMKLTEFAANMSSLLSTILLILYVIFSTINEFNANQTIKVSGSAYVSGDDTPTKAKVLFFDSVSGEESDAIFTQEVNV